MNAGKYTPGPWGLEPETDGTLMVAYSANPWSIRAIIFDNHNRSDPNWIANMRLIEVAPEMYEAMAEFVYRCEIGEVRSRKTYAKFKEILAKAEGR